MALLALAALAAPLMTPVPQQGCDFCESYNVIDEVPPQFTFKEFWPGAPINGTATYELEIDTSFLSWGFCTFQFPNPNQPQIGLCLPDFPCTSEVSASVTLHNSAGFYGMTWTVLSGGGQTCGATPAPLSQTFYNVQGDPDEEVTLVSGETEVACGAFCEFLVQTQIDVVYSHPLLGTPQDQSTGRRDFAMTLQCEGCFGEWPLDPPPVGGQ